MTIPINKVFSLSDTIAYRKYQITSKELINDFNHNIILYAMDEEESISSESSPHRKMVIVLDGSLQIKMDDTSHKLQMGQSFLMDQNIKHSIEAQEQCKFIQINFTNK